MHNSSLHELINKKSRLTIGLMSGTSADGLDIALCEVNTSKREFKNLHSETVSYSDELRGKILEMQAGPSVQFKNLISLSSYLGHFYSEAIECFLKKHRIAIGSIDLIGSHGQTVAHLSEKTPYLDRTSYGTLQIGDADIIAKTLGIATISDFRSGDVAVGGTGAPLAPVYHQFRFASERESRVIINIGGISNVTLLTSSGKCLASDSGPGNCLLDSVISKLGSERFDEDGSLARSGSIDSGLLSVLLNAPTFNRTLPTSLDRSEVVAILESQEVRNRVRSMPIESLMATLTELTAISIQRAIYKLAESEAPTTAFICGGGWHNKYLMERLEPNLKPIRVHGTSHVGVNEDFVEAEAFAYLANLALDNQPGNVPRVTGASRPAILGKISLP